MNRKTLAIFLSLAMILSLLAANGLAFAEDAHPEAPAEEPQVVEVEEKTEEPAAVEETVVTEPVEKEEVTEEPAEEVKTPAEESEEVEETVVTEPVEKEDEVTEEPTEEVKTPAEGTEVPEETVPEAPAENEEPVPEEQPGKETQTPEAPVVPDVPVAPVNPEEVEVVPEQNLPNHEVNDVVGGGNSGVEGLPVVPEVPQQPVCSCGVNEGEAHAEDCPMYEAPAQPAPVVPAVPVEGCTCDTLSEDPQDHDVDCPVFLATINRLQTAVIESLYERAMACETYEELMTVFGTASDEEIAALTEAEFNEIRNFAESMRPVPVIETVEIIEPEGEIVESEIDAYGESFTNAAPFVDNK